MRRRDLFAIFGEYPQGGSTQAVIAAHQAISDCADGLVRPIVLLYPGRECVKEIVGLLHCASQPALKQRVPGLFLFQKCHDLNSLVAALSSLMNGALTTAHFAAVSVFDGLFSFRR
jgi:hypothetical protein